MKAEGKKTILVGALIFLAIVLYVSPLFSHPAALLNDDPYRYHDYLQQATYDFLFRQAIVEHHQFPLRTHMLGGGYPLMANPQDCSFSPFSITTLIFKEALGIKINILLFFLIGAFGMAILVRKGLDLPLSGAIFAALAYCFSAWWASRVEWGFYFKLYFHLFPILFYFYLKAKRSLSFLLLAGMTLFVISTQLGLGFVVIFLYIFCYGAVDYLSGIQKNWRPAFIGKIALLALLVFALGAVRIIPMAKLVSQNPREVGEYEDYENSKHPYPNFYKTAADFGYALTHYDSTPNFPIHPGWGALLLAAIGAVAAFRKSWKFLVLTVLFSWFSFGPFAVVDIWRPLFFLPMFSSMHQPYQLTNYFILFGISVLAAYSFTLLEKLPGKIAPTLVCIVPLLFLIQPYKDNRHIYQKTFTKQAPHLPYEQQFYQVRGKSLLRGAPRTEHSHQYFNVLRNVGTIDWDGDVLLEENAVPKELVDHQDNVEVNPDYRGEVYWISGKGTAKLEKITPNRIEVTASSGGSDWLIINQNYDPAWRVDGGLDIENREGLIAIRFDSQANRKVALSYRPTNFYIGLMISLVSWCAAIAMLVFRKKL